MDFLRIACPNCSREHCVDPGDLGPRAAQARFVIYECGGCQRGFVLHGEWRLSVRAVPFNTDEEREQLLHL